MIQNIPTDNLYKFKAIFGLVLVLLPLWYTFETFYSMLDLGIESHKPIFEQENNINLIEEETDLLSEAFKAMDTTTLRGKEARHRMFADIYSKTKVLVQEKNKLEILEYKKRGWELEKDKFYVAMCFSAGLSVIGLILMVSGFNQWYKRVQIFQDRILEKQADPE